MLKLLIAGAGTPTGRELASLLRRQNLNFQTIPDRQFILADKPALRQLLQRQNPTQVINLHTYKANSQFAMNKAENAAEKCHQVQFRHTKLLAEICGELEIPLLQLSNAYVFDGEKKLGYNEQDEKMPIGVYGKATDLAEAAVAALPKHLILRTGWLFGLQQCDAITGWIRTCKQNQGVVEASRRRISPTAIEDLARVVLAICRQLDCDADVWGVYHYCGLETKKESEFALQVLKYASQHDEGVYQLLDSMRITETQINSPEIANATLSSKKVFDTFGIKQRSWHGSLQAVIKSGIHGSTGSFTVVAGDSKVRDASNLTNKSLH